MDVTRKAEVEALYRLADELGGVDVSIQNAGVITVARLEDLSEADWDRIMDVNTKGTFLCCQAALPALEKSDRAAIINIGGLTAYTGAAHRVHVITAKAGLDGMTKALAVELAPKGITVNLVAPGLIETKRDGEEPVHRKTRTILAPRRGKPEDVASMVRHLAGPHGRYITGQTIHINGGVYLP